MDTFGLTHLGRVRDRNEDRFLIRELAGGALLMAVADGMGGEARGDFAADIMRESLDSLQNRGGDKNLLLRSVIREANRFILEEAEKNAELEGMGTTITCALLIEGVVYWAHVGDSRMYLLRERDFIQVTKDHNLAQFLIEEGEITPEEARSHHLRHLMVQCVGYEGCEPDVGHLEIKGGDLLMLSTDGLHDEISHERLYNLIISPDSLERKAESMLNAALEEGGKDNITLILAAV